ncbi:MAG TPA: hypothetical protein PLA52_05615, partial [Candidatus Omnitrophota bacterium]|nr:hypothetical protein [Candidatus Omnitrophota bacterium]
MPKDNDSQLKIRAAFVLLAAIPLFFSVFRTFETYELQTLDLRFNLRPPVKVSPDIVIIEIAEDT